MNQVLRGRRRTIASAAAAAALVFGGIVTAAALSTPATGATDPASVLQCAADQMHHTSQFTHERGGKPDPRPVEQIVNDVLTHTGYASLTTATKRVAFSSADRRDLAVVDAGGKTQAYFSFTTEAGNGLALDSLTMCSGAERIKR